MSIEQVAESLGVHYMTVYRYLRTGRLPAEREGGRWRIRPDDLALLAPPATGKTRPARGTGTSKRGSASLTKATGRLKDRLVSGDAAGAWKIVESALLAGSPSDVHLRLLSPCLRSIGDDWERGRLTIADEHRATAVALGVVGRLGPLFSRRGRRRPGGVTLLAGAQSDPHYLPLAMVADHLRAAGMEVIHLGADVPLDTLATAAGTADLRAVGLSASTSQGVANAGAAIDELRRRAPGVPVVLGGPAVPTVRAARLAGADGWAADAAGAVDLFLGLAAGRSSA